MPDNGQITPIGGLGLGRFEQYGMSQVVVDTAQPGFPDKRIDVLLIPAGEIQPITAIQVPRGVLVTFIGVEVSAQIRAQIQALQKRPNVDTLHNPAEKR